MSSAGSSERGRLVESLYQRALDLPAADREAYLRAACGGDGGLLSEARSLLEHFESAPDGFLESAAHALPDTVATGAAPQRIGAYEILGVLGRGGMGIVYEAEQQQPRRRVALKVIRGDAFSSDALRRFQHEADVLGQLRHPGIAQIHEFGVGDVYYGTVRTHAQPFFAMELVRGSAIIAHATAHRLDRVARLHLLVCVCDAVHHAHQKGVIHRDLKPSNIVVDEDGRPKVLDFGVARLTSADPQQSTTHTSAGQWVGTVPYMSPELLAGEAHRIDTRSDVYALGVIAFELLVGRLPLPLEGLNPLQAARRIAEREIPRAGSLRPDLRGDLEAILAKALEREPERRYASAAEFAADMRRHLRHEPITARPASLPYQLRKFARRHRTLVAASFIVLAVLLSATVWTTVAMLAARRATQHALAMNDFLNDIIAAADPATGRADVRLVEVLRAAGDEAAARFADSPAFEAEVRATLARAFSNLSIYDDALTHAERAYELRREALGPADPLTLRVASHLADLLKRARRYDEAIATAQQVLTLTPPDLQFAKDALGARRTLAGIEAVRGDLNIAEREFRAVLAAARERLGADHPAALASANDVAWFLQMRARRNLSPDRLADLRESAELYRSIIEPLIQRHGEDGYPTLNVMSNLGHTLRLLGDFDEAGAWAERVESVATPRYGADHDFVCRARTVLAGVRFAQARYAEAADLAVRRIESERRITGGRDSAASLSGMNDLLHIIDAGGRLAEGEQYARVLNDWLGGEGAHESGQALKYRTYLARFISRQGRLDEAQPLFDGLLTAPGLLADPALQALFDLAYGGHLRLRGQLEEAEQRLRAAQQATSPNDALSPVIREELRLIELRERRSDGATEGVVQRNRYRARTLQPPASSLQPRPTTRGSRSA